MQGCLNIYNSLLPGLQEQTKIHSFWLLLKKYISSEIHMPKTSFQKLYIQAHSRVHHPLLIFLSKPPIPRRALKRQASSVGKPQ